MNEVTLVGRWSKDPELRHTSEDKPVADCRIAVNRTKSDTTDFIPVIVWGNTAKAVAEHTKKGSLVGVHGRIQVREYEKEGTRYWITEVVAEKVKFLDRKKEEE
ncbi:MAG: single-stranded DNA-binding protein [Peptococcaceae bacterium]|nr:single-stranded DNA-binding protein [Peptococcaceae bacterium]